jgi:hypothetical protein
MTQRASKPAMKIVCLQQSSFGTDHAPHGRMASDPEVVVNFDIPAAGGEI